MNIWPTEDAQARFGKLLQTCRPEGPQMVTDRGAEAAVLVPIDEWRRMHQAVRPSSDGAIFRRWARLMHKRSDDLYEDAMIAATAEVHNLTVVTRNVRDFKLLGAKTVDPFAVPRG